MDYRRDSVLVEGLRLWTGSHGAHIRSISCRAGGETGPERPRRLGWLDADE
jgi:hypothetical protein